MLTTSSKRRQGDWSFTVFNGPWFDLKVAWTHSLVGYLHFSVSLGRKKINWFLSLFCLFFGLLFSGRQSKWNFLNVKTTTTMDYFKWPGLLHRISLRAPKFCFTQFHEHRDYATHWKKYMISQLKDRCIKSRPNDRNSSTQHIATFATSCTSMAALLRCLATCWLLLTQILKWSNFGQPHPTCRNRAAKRAQHVAPITDIVWTCCGRLTEA